MGSPEHLQREEYFLETAANGVFVLAYANVFNRLPGHDKEYVPMSEYLFKILQPRLDDLLFIGRNYERSVDEFEVLFALAVADLRKQANSRIWIPIGRFGWKLSNRDNPPLKRILGEARAMGNRWEPLQAGLFGGNVERFNSSANEFEQIIAELKWW